MDIEDNYKNLQDLVREQCKAREFHLKKKLSGKSGDEVYLCDITIESPAYSGFAIIKYSTNSTEYSKNEFEAHQLATTILPEFAEQHIPKLIKKVDGDNQSAFIMTIAGSGLGLTEELASVDHTTQTNVMCSVSELLLTQWHNDKIADECSAQDVLFKWLDYRISDGSRLPKLLDSLLSISPQSESFYFSSNSFPNPYYYAANSHSRLSEIRLRPLEGCMHGDLHGHNCLYGGLDKGKQREFLIDFEQFKPQMPMFFDHAYLEFSLLLNNHADTPMEEWIKVTDLLCNIEECEQPEPVGLNGDILTRVLQIHTYRKNIRKWAIDHYENRIEDVYNQLILARIAVGLNFANKGRLADDEVLSNKMKVSAFIYAAANLHHLLKAKNISVSEPKAIAQSTLIVPLEDEDTIQTIWSECDYFSRHKAKYIFLAGEKLRTLPSHDSQWITSLPWNLVLDFDVHGDGLHDKSKRRLSESIAWKHCLPRQINNNLEMDILIWLSVNGHELDSESLYSSFKEWRRDAASRLRVLSQGFARRTSVLPVNLVVVAENEDINKVKHILEALDESLEEQLKVIVICGDDIEMTAYQELGRALELDDIKCFKCQLTEFTRSISQYYSMPSADDKVLIPVRSTSGNKLSKIEVPKDLHAASSKCINILHSGMADQKSNIGQFHRGHQISWSELEQNLAIDLSIDKKVQSKVVEALVKNSYEKCTVYHKPGAGGSTVLKKVAWRLKNDWPVIEVVKNSTNIHEYVEQISILTNLPLVIIVDGTVLSSTEKDKLTNELKVRGVNHVLLESERGEHSTNRNHSVLSIPCPLKNEDAEAFHRYYRALANPDRSELLDKLTNDDNMVEYRQPFFYGFFTFEEEYKSIDSFIQNSTCELLEDRKKLLIWLSLISHYTQDNLPISFINVILGRAPTSVFRVKEVFGTSAAPLFLVEDASVRIIHPVIARQLIFRLLDKDDEMGYATRFQDSCLELISILGTQKLRDEEQTEKILQGLFIARKSEVNQENGGKGKFSELLSDIKSSNKQHKVLKYLCDSFPDNAHYFSHLGRHINYDPQRDSKEAIGYFQKAIELDPESEVHYHGLAMVYSNLVKETIRDIKSNPTLETGLRYRAVDVIDKIEDNYELSREFFMTAYDRGWKSEHALVSYTKLIQGAVEAIYRQSKPVDTGKKHTYCDFFKQNNEASQWCREELEELEWSITELKRIQDEDKISHHAEETISKVPKFYDDKEGLIEGLTNLMTSHKDIDHTNTRRLLASTYFKVHEESGLSDKNLDKIVDLMEINIASNRGDDRDIKHWFRAYRMSPSFSYYEAIDKIEVWERLRKSVHATYYLYILHYFSYREGVLSSQQKAKDYIEKCRRNIPVSTTSKKSFEWVSSDTKRTLPLVNAHELGKWDGFFANKHKLGRVTGIITSVDNQKKGAIRVNGFDAFFVPKSDFITDDVNSEVSFYLGFSYEGLRAWQVEKTK